MKIPEGTVSLYLRVSPQLKAWLQDYAARRDAAMNEIVIAAVEEYLQKNDPLGRSPWGK